VEQDLFRPAYARRSVGPRGETEGFAPAGDRFTLFGIML
jgi:hypothetical protein